MDRQSLSVGRTDLVEGHDDLREALTDEQGCRHLSNCEHGEATFVYGLLYT